MNWHWYILAMLVEILIIIMIAIFFILYELKTMAPLGWHPPYLVGNAGTLYLGDQHWQQRVLVFFRFLIFCVYLFFYVPVCVSVRLCESISSWGKAPIRRLRFDFYYREYVVCNYRIKKAFLKSVKHYVFVHGYFHKMLKCLPMWRTLWF